MKVQLPEYVSRDEVRRVCAALSIRNWTELQEAKVTPEEAEAIRAELGGEALQIPLEEFIDGLEVELEHGLQYADANVTNNHPLLTGKIVLAHLKEMLDYYVRLRVAELEGDLFKALVRRDADALLTTYDRVLSARAELARSESQRTRAP